MDNILGDEIYENRISQGLTQDQFGKVYSVSGPAIFKFEKGYVKPSFQLWLRMAKDFKIPEKKAVLMWIKSRLPSEYQSLIDLREMAVAEEGEAYGEPEKPADFSRFTDRDELRRQVLDDPVLPKGLKAMVKDDEIWAIYKPTGHEINVLRDAFTRFGKGTKALYREALRLIREFSGAE